MSIQTVFLFAAALTLWAAFMMVTRRNLMHTALYLIVTLFGVAIFFVILEAGFLAVVQVIVYIGAIAIMVIFAIMLTRGDGPVDEEPVNTGFGWGALLAALFAFGLIILIGQWPAVYSLAPRFDGARDTIRELGIAFVSPEQSVLPFELAGILLLAAFIGAVTVSRVQKKK